MNRLSSVRTVIGTCAVMLLVAGCGAGSPEEKVARLRGMYSARLNGFLVQEPVEAEPEAVGEEGAEAAAAEAEAAAGEEEMVEPMETEPANPDIMLDILIQHDSPELLPGITVDITMVDETEAELERWRVWFDTSTVKKANVTQYTHVLEDVPYEEGYGFHAEIRHPVPAAERGSYKEFSSAG